MWRAERALEQTKAGRYYQENGTRTRSHLIRTRVGHPSFYLRRTHSERGTTLSGLQNLKCFVCFGRRRASPLRRWVLLQTKPYDTYARKYESTMSYRCGGACSPMTNEVELIGMQAA